MWIFGWLAALGKGVVIEKSGGCERRVQGMDESGDQGV